MSRAIQKHNTVLVDDKGERVPVGAKVNHPSDRRAAIVGGWDPEKRHVLIWTVPARAGDVRHLTPWPAEELGLAWGTTQ